MNTIDIKRMRKKQILVSNVLLITVLPIYFFILNLINITFSTHFLILSIMMFIQAIVNLVKRYSTKSFIPVYEQVAHYEKSKMGKEWMKQRKSVWILNFVLSVSFFIQYLVNRNSSNVLEFELFFMGRLLFLLLVIMNISMLLHISKVDRATSESDFKGYTWKWQIISIVFGIVLAFFIIMFTIFYLLATI
ncbi:hypothetical protein [Peribacillus alkalitolerans]|uniref:hypothetical protein n=1 Tax=Peribacillus alkalitolerans TaxID=1550385 RepID=UPI0013D3B52E|nr:hypothetical protein [Peribacillus alkalitolerans]